MGSDLSVRQTLRELQVPRATFYTWYRRYIDGGLDGLTAAAARRVTIPTTAKGPEPVGDASPRVEATPSLRGPPPRKTLRGESESSTDLYWLIGFRTSSLVRRPTDAPGRSIMGDGTRGCGI